MPEVLKISLDEFDALPKKEVLKISLDDFGKDEAPPEQGILGVTKETVEAFDKGDEEDKEKPIAKEPDCHGFGGVAGEAGHPGDPGEGAGACKGSICAQPSL